MLANLTQVREATALEARRECERPAMMRISATVAGHRLFQPATAGQAASALPEAGYSGTPLPRKLGIGEDDEVLVVGAADGFTDRLTALLGDEAVIHTDLGDASLFDVIIAFMTRRAELEDQLDRLRSKMAPACGLWIAWPKKSSGEKTDLDENQVRAVGLAEGLVDVKVCAVDETWSGLKFVVRLADRRK